MLPCEVETMYKEVLAVVEKDIEEHHTGCKGCARCKLAQRVLSKINDRNWLKPLLPRFEQLGICVRKNKDRSIEASHRSWPQTLVINTPEEANAILTTLYWERGPKG
jgi:hypothetical protein